MIQIQMSVNPSPEAATQKRKELNSLVENKQSASDTVFQADFKVHQVIRELTQ